MRHACRLRARAWTIITQLDSSAFAVATATFTAACAADSFAFAIAAVANPCAFAIAAAWKLKAEARAVWKACSKLSYSYLYAISIAETSTYNENWGGSENSTQKYVF
jgi:hypothetical protein